jgi:hypothetical protein
MEKIKELILDDLHKTYHCGWNNTIRITESNQIIDINMLVDNISDKFNTPVNKAEAYIMFFLIETTEDTSSILEYWKNNRRNNDSVKKKVYRRREYGVEDGEGEDDFALDEGALDDLVDVSVNARIEDNTQNYTRYRDPFSNGGSNVDDFATYLRNHIDNDI